MLIWEHLIFPAWLLLEVHGGTRRTVTCLFYLVEYTFLKRHIFVEDELNIMKTDNKWYVSFILL